MKNIYQNLLRFTALTLLFSSASVYANTGKTVNTVSDETSDQTSITQKRSVVSSEPWKGVTETSPLELGMMAGATLYGTDVNWSILATGAYLLLEQGWADEVDDRVWIELQAGPAFFSVANNTSTGMQYSTHLRWDFSYNECWTFYGLGGLAGFVLPKSLGNSFTIHPRFGAGVQYQTKTALMFRAEISHEFMGAGFGLNF